MANAQTIDSVPDSSFDAREVSCRVTNSLLKYLDSKGYDTHAVTGGLSYSEGYLRDTFNWVRFDIREALVQRAIALTSDPEVMFKVGLSTPRLSSLSGLEQLVLRLGGPRVAYSNVSKYASMFDKSTIFSVKMEGNNKATVSMSLRGGHRPPKSMCYYARGILAAIPTLWELPPAGILEKECLCLPSENGIIPGVLYGADRCSFEVTWETPNQLFSKPGRKRLRLFRPRSRSVEDLEDTFRLLDEKNTELRARNAQLSKVRELSLSIDGLKNREQVIRTIVESAREIPGVALVMVLTWHCDDKERVIAPYVSRIRNKAVDSALKIAGFDIDKMLGDKPDSGQFSYFSANSTLQKSYLSNPRTMEIPLLANLMDGIWPKILCDSIQRIAGIKMATLVPIIIDGALGGSLVFLLQQDVPVDILEMAGAHLASALKNAASIETLERHNKELVALNNVTKEATSSLHVESMLERVIQETAAIFNCEFGAIYLSGESDTTLKMRASTRMPGKMLEYFKLNSIDRSVSGELCKSNLDILAGDLRDYARKNPACAAQEAGPHKLPFAAASLNINSERCGFICIVRPEREPFNSHELTLLRSLSNQLSISTENARLHSDMLLKMVETETAKAELARMMSALTRSNQELEQFAYVASHDLQEPLRMVASYLQLLEKRYAPGLQGEAKEFMDFAIDGASRMQGMIRDLLQYSRVNTQAQPLKAISAQKVFNTTLLNLQQAIADSGAQVKCDPLPVVMGHDSQLVQLLQNLIANAIKFHGPAAPEILVAVKDAGKFWEFSVSDNGIGIDPQYNERIFMIFQKLHTRGEYPGSGIGLAVCKRIVERHGGSIRVESQPGKGSNFIFTLAKGE